jgi:hypothetical protein
MSTHDVLAVGGGAVALLVAAFSGWSVLSPRAKGDVPATPSPRAPRRPNCDERRTLRCQIGDLAVIVRSDVMPETIGKMVSVEGIAADGDFDWTIRSLGSPFQVLPTGVHFDRAYCLDVCLRPIRPPGASQHTIQGQDQPMAVAHGLSHPRTQPGDHYAALRGTTLAPSHFEAR